MTIGIDQYRMRVVLFKPNRQQSKCYLNLCEVLCIGLIINTRNKKHALLAAVLISCLTEFKVEITSLPLRSLHIKLFNLPARGTCANGIFTSPPLKFTSPPYQDNFVQGLDQRLK